MNTQFRTLLNQAEAAADEIFDRQGRLYGEIVMEKFGELIVKRCTDVLDEDSYLFPELGGYAHDIRKLFGVKDI